MKEEHRAGDLDPEGGHLGLARALPQGPSYPLLELLLERSVPVLLCDPAC